MVVVFVLYARGTRNFQVAFNSSAPTFRGVSLRSVEVDDVVRPPFVFLAVLTFRSRGRDHRDTEDSKVDCTSSLRDFSYPRTREFLVGRNYSDEVHLTSLVKSKNHVSSESFKVKGTDPKTKDMTGKDQSPLEPRDSTSWNGFRRDSPQFIRSSETFLSRNDLNRKVFRDKIPLSHKVVLRPNPPLLFIRQLRNNNSRRNVQGPGTV